MSAAMNRALAPATAVPAANTTQPPAHSGPAPCCTGRGTSDSRKRAGNDYGTITEAQIRGMMAQPKNMGKLDAPWLIQSSYCAPDAREHQAQRARGTFWGLTLDVDTGNHDADTVLEAVRRVMGDVRLLIYSTRSATEDDRRWRVLIPLARPLAGADFEDTAGVAFDMIEEATSGLLALDRKMALPGQIAFLPNRGAFYHANVVEGTPLLLDDAHPIIRRRDANRDAAAAKRAEAQAEATACRAQRRAAAGGGDKVTSVIEAFNAANTVADRLAKYGYEQRGDSHDWRSPHQTSGSYATHDYGDHWVSLSSSDAAAGIGSPSVGGARFGDAFDLFAHHEHEGDTRKAVAAAAEALGIADGGKEPAEIVFDPANGAQPMDEAVAQATANETPAQRANRLWRSDPGVTIEDGTPHATITSTLGRMRDAEFFDYGDLLATIHKGRVSVITSPRVLATKLTALFPFRKRGKNGLSPCNPPPDAMQTILELKSERGLRPLAGVIDAPTIRLDGAILREPGYDAATRLYLDPTGQHPPDIPDYPTEAEARTALEMLLEPFSEFPTPTAEDRGALLAAILTAAVRPVLPTTPLFAIDAPVQGTGKSLLAGAVGALAQGARVPTTTPCHSEEEWEKRLIALHRAGPRVVILDNLTGTFDSPSWAAAVTAGKFVGRVLGGSDMTELPQRAMILLTSNNVSLGSDIARRTVNIRLDAEMENPTDRVFQLGDPVENVLDKRMDLIGAALTLIRAAQVRGQHLATDGVPSFEGWNALVRRAVIYTNTVLMPGEFGDPRDTMRANIAADPAKEALNGLLRLLRDNFGDEGAHASDLAKRISAEQNPYANERPFTEALRALGVTEPARMGTVALGRALGKRRGQRAGGFVLSCEPDRDGLRVYRALPESVSPASPAK